jgi:hypothetical protein
MFLHTILFADEGMWLPFLLKNSKEADMKAAGLKISAEDIYSVNKSSLKDAVLWFGKGCSGGVISDQGLLLTNHHCGYGRIQSHSTVENDLLSNGFWAKDLASELANPDKLSVTFVIQIQDVTEKVLQGISPEMSESQRQDKIAANYQLLTTSATSGTHYDAFIKSFFYGNQYLLYIVEEFKDVRLVGTPPNSIGKFGADADNWMWPRHTGDFSVFRIYANSENKPAAYSPDNKPFRPRNFFQISLKGIKENDFTMVYGFPGRTQQFIPSFGVDYVVNISNPVKIQMREKNLTIIDAAMKSSDKIRIQYSARQANIANAYKKWQGESKGLKKLNTIEKKKELENEIDQIIKNDPKLAKYEGIHKRLEALYRAANRYNFAYDGFFELYYMGPAILSVAKEYGDFLRQYQNASDKAQAKNKYMASIAERFKDLDLNTEKQIFTVLTETYLNSMNKEDVSAKLLEQIFAFQSPSGLANALYQNSVFADLERLKKFVESDRFDKPDADLAYQLANHIFQKVQSEILPVRDSLNSLIDKEMRYYVELIRIAKPKNYWPDANSTLRVSYGKVRNSSPNDGVVHSYFTTIDGVVEKYVPQKDSEFYLDDKFLDLHKRKDYGRYGKKGELVVCFIANNHTTGGNSGSPVLNAEGRLIGLNFDRSWESTMSDIAYSPDICRNITVDIRFVLFVIEKYANATHLISEMKIVE